MNTTNSKHTLHNHLRALHFNKNYNKIFIEMRLIYELIRLEIIFYPFKPIFGMRVIYTDIYGQTFETEKSEIFLMESMFPNARPNIVSVKIQTTDLKHWVNINLVGLFVSDIE